MTLETTRIDLEGLAIFASEWLENNLDGLISFVFDWLVLQRHMIINYPEYNNVTFRFEHPCFSTSVVFEGHENLWLAGCVSDDTGLSRMLDNTPFVEPKAETPARQLRLMQRSEPARPSGTNSEAFFSLRD